MKRQRTARKTVKARRRKITNAKPSSVLRQARRGHMSAVDLQKKLEHQARELEEAREERAAVAEVLRIISSSPGELEPLFQAMLAKATRLCEAKFGALYLLESRGFRAVAVHGSAPPSFVEARRQHPLLAVIPGTALGRVAATKQPVQIADAQAEPAYRGSTAHAVGVEMGGLRTVLSVPMLKEGELVGAFNLFRQKVRPFTDKQIELVKNFAAQAVIAIENTRLMNELKQSLEQQTATADVLRIISSSPGELEPVFQAMLENATHICEAKFGTLFRFDGENFRPVAQFNTPAALLEVHTRRGPFQPPPGSQLDRVMQTKRVSHTADYAAEAVSSPAVTLGGARSIVMVPMRKDDGLIGAISIYRQEVRPFTDKQIELVTNFAAQAVIAIENARLLNELRESLQQQTATAEVLSVISSSPGELKPVFKAMLENAVRLCRARPPVIFLRRLGVGSKPPAKQIQLGDVLAAIRHASSSLSSLCFYLFRHFAPGSSHFLHCFLMHLCFSFCSQTVTLSGKFAILIRCSHLKLPIAKPFAITLAA